MKRTAFVLIFSLPFLLAGCSGGDKADASAGGQKPAAQPPVPVTVGTVVKKTVPVQIEADTSGRR